MVKLKKLSKKQAEELLSKIDIEGFDYYFNDYSSEEFIGTELEVPAKEYRAAYSKLHDLLEEIREKYQIEVQ